MRCTAFETLITTVCIPLCQGRNEVRWRPDQEASLAPPCSDLRSLGSKWTLLKKELVTLLVFFGAPRSHSAPPLVNWRPRNCAPFPTLVTPLLCAPVCTPI